VKAWLREIWADPVARIALLVALVSVVPAWFLWPGDPTMEAIDAIVIAAFLTTLWIRDLFGEKSSLLAAGLVIACAGLLIEAAYYLGTDDRPTVVAWIFPFGLLVLLGAALMERRSGRTM
jgi:hypothetical protein